MGARMAYLLGVVLMAQSSSAESRQEKNCAVKINVTDWPEHFRADENFSWTFRVTIGGEARVCLPGSVLAQTVLVYDPGGKGEEQHYKPFGDSSSLTPGGYQQQASQAYLHQISKSGTAHPWEATMSHPTSSATSSRSALRPKPKRRTAPSVS